jgi:hypothetical protein
VSGPLGPLAVQRLRAITLARERLAREEVELLATIADAQGHALDGEVRFDYDLDAATWRVVIPLPIEEPTT